MSQKTILSFFKQSETSATKVKSDKSTSNIDIKILSKLIKVENSSNNKDAEKQVESSSVVTNKSDLNNDSDSNLTLKGDMGKPRNCPNSNTKKLSTKEPVHKSNNKKEPTKRSSKVLSSLDNPEEPIVKANKSKANGKCENSILNCFNDSPVKQPKKRKRIQQIVDSDEDSKESEEKEAEISNRDVEEMADDETPNDRDTEVTNIAIILSKTPSKKSSEHPTKRRKTSQSKKAGYPDIGDADIFSKSVKKEELIDSHVAAENFGGSLSENSGVENHWCTPSTSQGTPNDSTEFIPKRKTARKQVNGGKLKKELEMKASDLIQKETELLSKPNSSPDNGEYSKTENEKSPQKTEESDERNSSDEDPKEGEKKESSESKKKIHSFFTKKKEPDATSTEEEITKKDIKSSPAAGTFYDPSKTRYHPIDDACWKKGEKTPYLALAKTLEIIEETSARLKIIEILANYLRSVIVLSPEDLLYSVYLCLNRLAPEYEGIELGVGDMLLMRAVAQATGRTVEKIKAEVVVKGDLGLVAESSRGNQRVMFAPPKLTVASVFSKFKEIAKMSGNTVMSKKVDKIQALFVACRECEARYIIRSLSGKLRIGLAEQSVLAALARASVLTPPNQSYPPEIIDKPPKMSADDFKEFLQEQTLILKTTYCECPNFDMVIPVLLKECIAGLPTHCQLQPGCPLKPMLAHPTNGINEVLNRFDKNEFTCEYKYDGERAQIHRTTKGEVKIFSRNQEDNTSKYPDVISRLPKTLKESTTSFILDTEAVAWDSETKQILPFQVLSTRKKKDAVESDIVVQVCIVAFDLLYLNGESLVKKPLKERRELLHSSFVEVENEFMFVKYRDGDNAETMQEFLDESVKGNCEGLMVKALSVDASYEIAKRSHNWLKLKKDYLNGIGDTLDLVVIGGYHGKGKRKGFYGGFLLACYDDDNEEFQSICKLGTGFSDKELKTHTDFFKDHVISEPKSYYRFDSSLEPDVWFNAVQIWEIKCADLSISPVHKAAIGIVDPEKGISLRFPRFLRIREDKSKPEDATVASRIAEMYQNQEQVQNTMNKKMKSEEDFY